MKSPIELLSCLINDTIRLEPGVKGLKRDLITLESRFENEGFSFLAKTLSTLDGALLRGLSSGRFTCPAGFKSIRGGTIPVLLQGMFCEIFEPISGTLKENVNFGVLKALHGVLQFFKKTQLSSDSEAMLHTQAVTEFYRCDESAGQAVIPDRHDHLIGRVGKLILNNLLSKDVENAKYRHGPGAVYSGLRPNQKWLDVDQSLRDGELDLVEFGLEAFPASLESTGRDSCGSRRTVCLSRQTEGTQPFQTIPTALIDRASRSRARLISVAKNSSSRRTITVEPVLNMFIQQGLNTILRDSISECRILGNIMALTDQRPNQIMALEGSRFDNWSTIDLKSASDLMSLRLVKSVFRHHGPFLDKMIACRTPIVECQGLPDIQLEKFAGMGNALTFPVQSVCFAVICLAAIMDHHGSCPDARKLRRASRHVRVYGDDIIVSTKYAHQVVSWLEDVGLRVNINKSFLVGNFKESCGVDAFRGVNITPIFCRYLPAQKIVDSPSAMVGFVQLSNRLWLEGLYSASTWVRDMVERSLGRPLPLVSHRSGVLGWHSRQDAVEPHKWCHRTQQFLTRAVAVVSQKRNDKLDGYAALFKSLTTPLLGRDKDHLSKTTMRYKTRLVRRWVPSYAF